jgi:CCR4-NOT transcriptional regulation complex NOT5 subunit
MPFVGYSEMVNNFIDDVYTFEESNKDMELTRYGDILKDNGLEWGTESMKNADVSNVNVQCVLALIMGAVRAERFCDGALLDFFKSGCILKWLQRLNSIE